MKKMDVEIIYLLIIAFLVVVAIVSYILLSNIFKKDISYCIVQKNSGNDNTPIHDVLSNIRLRNSLVDVNRK